MSLDPTRDIQHRFSIIHDPPLKPTPRHFLLWYTRPDASNPRGEKQKGWKDKNKEREKERGEGLMPDGNPEL